MEDWKFGPPVLVGERVLWVKNDRKATDSGVVRWIGKLSNDSKDWTVGIELDKPLPCDGTDGSWGGRKLFHCNSRRGVFLPLHRIQKEVSNIRLKNKTENLEEKLKNLKTSMGRKDKYEKRENSPNREDVKTDRTLKEIPEWINSIGEEKGRNASSDSDDLKSDFQNTRKLVRRQKKRSKSPKVVARKEDFYSGLRRSEVRRPFSVTGRINENYAQSKDKWQKKYESCALEERYIREFIQREISKHQNFVKNSEADVKMNDVKGNFKKIDEDDIYTYASENLDSFHDKPPKKFDNRASRRSDAFHPREKSNGFFSFLKWFKKSKEMPELERMKDSSVTSSPLFIRRRSSSCGSVDTLFSIATVNSFAFISPVQYQAVISSSHTTYPVPVSIQISDDDVKSKKQSEYENNSNKIIEEVKSDGFCSEERRKKCRAPDPPRDISLPSTLEHKKTTEDDDADGKTGHRRTVSESFKDKKAGYYCHVQGKRKAPLPPPSAPLYPSLGSLRSQCPSTNKKKRPAPQPPEGKDNCTKAKLENLKSENQANTSNYDNVVPAQDSKNDSSVAKESPKANVANVSPLLGLKNDISSSPLPSRPWYKRSSSGSNITKKESVKSSDKKRNREIDEWMPEVGFSRRPVSNEGSHNIFNLLARLDRNQDKKKEEKRKSQISILANISELDREAAEIVRKEHAQEKKLIADKDEKYYTSLNALSSFPTADNDKQLSKVFDKREQVGKRMTKSPFDEFKLKPEVDKPKDVVQTPQITSELKEDSKDRKRYDASAELDYYMNPWNCPKCTLENPGWEKFCEACNTMRVKFTSIKENANKLHKAKVVQAEPKNNSPVPDKVAKEETKTETDDPSEDNLEGVRRKRLAFFLSRQNSSRDSTVAEDEKVKLKMMLKEMKNSLPKREKGVINNAPNEGNLIEGDPERKLVAEGDNLEPKEGTSGDADSKAKEFSNIKVQQTWQPIANDSNKYGAVKKRPEPAPSNVAEAIIITKTTVFEDVTVKKADKCHKVSSSAQTNSFVKNEDPIKNDILDSHIYTNIQNIKEKPGVLDLSVPENTFTNGDIEAITAKLQREGAGLADYKVDIQSATDTNTLDVNRLLKKLEAAINTGQHVEAANIAKELARMKVSCSVSRQSTGQEGLSKIIVDLYIEDKVTHKGPIQIRILPSITLAQLKMKVEKEWNIPRNVQRWILGKQLATDDNKTLEEHGVVAQSSPVFLYIVTPEQDSDKSESCLKNIEEPVKVERRNGKVLRAEARRPSLIIEEEGENVSEEDSSEETEKSPELSAPTSNSGESFRERGSFEKGEMNKILRKELKSITGNFVRDRVKWLNRVVGGSSSENAEQNRKKQGKNQTQEDQAQCHYNELVQLEKTDLVLNVEEFECPVCLIRYAPGEGVVLRDCLHIFCRACLISTIQFNEEAEVKCPYRDDQYSCESVLQEREIKNLVPKVIFEKHLAKSVSLAENKMGNAYHCKTPDCKGWCILEENVNEFRCPVCRALNCLTCQSIHTGLNCKQYQEQLKIASDTNAEAKKTKDMLEEMVEKGEALPCPTCQVVLMKKWGCDWLRCSMCKTEICWVTRGPRWGPGGKGDTTGGCQCGLNGVKCHPKCNFCH